MERDFFFLKEKVKSFSNIYEEDLFSSWLWRMINPDLHLEMVFFSENLERERGR